MTEPAPRIRILLVEDNLLARVGTATLLGTQPDFEVVGSAIDGDDGLVLWRKLRPDLTIVDMRMPRMDGVSFTSALIAEAPAARILVLTHFIGDEQIFRAMRAGARGYATKDTEMATLFEAVRTVAGGQLYLPGDIATKLDNHAGRKALSPRERQVLECLQKGLANKEIADRIGIAERTVQLHLGNIRAKLGAATRNDAVAIAIQRGILIVDQS